MKTDKRRQNQVVELSCPDCSSVAKGKTEQSARSGLNHHRKVKHGYISIRDSLSRETKMRMSSKEGTLLHHLRTSRNTDMGAALALWASSPR